MRAPLNSFKIDLPTIGQLLSEADQIAIRDMQAPKAASHSVLRVRIAAPCVYIIGATITLAVEYDLALASSSRTQVPAGTANATARAACDRPSADVR